MRELLVLFEGRGDTGAGLKSVACWGVGGSAEVGKDCWTFAKENTLFGALDLCSGSDGNDGVNNPLLSSAENDCADVLGVDSADVRGVNSNSKSIGSAELSPAIVGGLHTWKPCFSSLAIWQLGHC